MNVTRFHHVSVNCHDAALDDMVEFYRGLFGLDDRPRPEIPGVDGHWHAVGDSELHLVAAAPRDTPIDSTGNHYCVAVEDLDAAIAELDAQQIPYQRGVQGESVVQIWINDPAGNTIELQQETRAR
jgi:catechol 2,3-dioxygenase-like lactoylglutathione lyase family enzyme